MTKRLGQWLLVLIILLTLGMMLRGYASCTRQGGQYVRGLFWFECIR